jgi:hypothetical protein
MMAMLLQPSQGSWPVSISLMIMAQLYTSCAGNQSTGHEHLPSN